MPCLCLLRLFVVTRHLRDVAPWGLRYVSLWAAFPLALPLLGRLLLRCPGGRFGVTGYLQVYFCPHRLCVQLLGCGRRYSWLQCLRVSVLPCTWRGCDIHHGWSSLPWGFGSFWPRHLGSWPRLSKWVSLSLPPRFQLGCSLVHISLSTLWVPSGCVSRVRLVVPLLDSSSGM